MAVVLFLCTGNTCRSAMAAAIARHRFPGLTIRSAGIRAEPGRPMTPEAAVALAGLGISSEHRSQGLGDAVVAGCTHVFGMEPQHLAALGPWLGAIDPAPQVSLLAEGREIADPLHRGQAAYLALVEELDGLVRDRLAPHASSDAT